VLIGRKDDWTPASMAERLGAEYKNLGWKPEFSLTVYPNAFHGFDVEPPPGALKGEIDIEGHHFDYDPQEAADAITRTKSFLAKYLGAR
jgi:dienelactone hydrolase